MFDNDAVIADMRKIFSRSAADGPAVAAPAPASADPDPEAPSPARPTALFSRVDGIASIGFAVAVALIGIVAVPLLHQPAPPPLKGSAPAPDLSTPAPAFAVDHAISPPPAGSLPASIVSESVERSKVARAHRGVRVRHARRPWRHHRWRASRIEAPHLTGAALRKALAEDAVVTRRLNQEALRKLPSPAERRDKS